MTFRHMLSWMGRNCLETLWPPQLRTLYI